MHDATAEEEPGGRLTRRGLLVAGGVGAATLWLGPEWTVVDGVAEAATNSRELRRSGWLQATDPLLRATVDGRTVSCRLTGVTDLPIAAQVPALRDHDAAFAVRFSGPAGLEQGSWGFAHSELDTFGLFVVPVDEPRGGEQAYEAIVDRTVRIAGVTDDPVPPAEQVTVPPARAALPPATATATAVAYTGGHARPARAAGAGAAPRIRRIALERTRSRRSVVAEIAWANGGSAASVYGLLLARGRVVARAGGPVRRLSHLRMRLAGRRNVPAGRYELRLTVVDRHGRVTRIRRKVRVG